jgi:uncharacterized protein (DUF2164 family)
MTIEISREARQVAITSLQRYFKQNMEEEIGNLTANALLNFFIDDIGPLIYNKAVTDVQTRLQARVMDVDTEIYEEAFTYWNKTDRKKK